MARYFSWNPTKARANIRKHSIDFETAARAFSDPYAIRDFDRFVEGEERLHIFGRVDEHLLLLVVYTIEEDDDNEYIRIISARRADHEEEASYYTQNRELGNF